MRKRARAAQAMTLATRVVCNEEGNDDGGKRNGNEGNGQVTATRAMVATMATTWVMAMATRLAGGEEGEGDGGKGNGEGNEEGR